MNESGGQARVLITGGFGYVGGRIAQSLALNTDYLLRVSTHSSCLSRPSWLERGEIVNLDFLSEESLNQGCRGVQTIIHLAALNEIDSGNDPEQALLINSLGTLRLLQAAEKVGVKRFIYFSTAHVYGSPLCGTITETNMTVPVHPYAITHRVAEDFVLASNYNQKIEGIVLRLSNGLGVPVHPDVNRWTLITNDLCRQAVVARKLTLRSSGLQIRDFIALSDVCKAVIHLSKLPMNECDNGLFNLGGECSLRIIDLAERISMRCSAIMGYTPPIIKPEPKENERSVFLDYRIDKLKQTGFSLTGDLNQEVDNTLRLCLEAFGGINCQ